MELLIVKEIREYGLDAVISKYSLKVKDYGHKFVLKYDQIKSPLKNPAVRECRGLVLSTYENGLIPMSLGFKKFFNLGENVDTVDFSKAIIQEKLDGSLMVLYYDFIMNTWCIATTGTAEGEGSLSQYHGESDFTFASLFWDVFGKENISKLTKGLAYSFELTTPHNVVVVPHKKSSLTLLGIRNMKTGTESGKISLDVTSNNLGVKRPKFYTFDSIDNLLETAKELPYNDEGYIVSEYKGSEYVRVKIKSPQYVAHHMAKGNATSLESILDVILQGEQGEFISYFPQYKDKVEYVENIINKVKTLYDDYLHILQSSEFTFLETNRKVFVEYLRGFDSILFSYFLNKKLNQNIENLEEFVLEIVNYMGKTRFVEL